MSFLTAANSSAKYSLLLRFDRQGPALPIKSFFLQASQLNLAVKSARRARSRDGRGSEGLTASKTTREPTLGRFRIGGPAPSAFCGRTRGVGLRRPAAP